MLAHIRATLQVYCDATKRPVDVVKRWYRRLPDADKDRVLRNIEVANARMATGLVGDQITSSGIIDV